MRTTGYVAVLFLATVLLPAPTLQAQVKPGDIITKDNANQVRNLLSPGNLVLVQQGMQLNIVATGKLEWPPPYKSATEKYSAQVRLLPEGTLQNYVAGQPFPLLDPNDPQIAAKILWNFSFRPLYTDDADLRDAEVANYTANATGKPVDFFTVGHFAFYNNIGRIEVPPIPTDPDAAASGIRYRFGFYPLLEPSSLRGFGLIRFRHIDPKVEDNTWTFQPGSRRVRRQSPAILSDAIGMLAGFGSHGSAGGSSGPSGGTAYASVIDPDSYFGFAAKIEDYNYKYLGEKDMLACAHAKNSPAVACPYDGGRSICPENWEIRHLYSVEANAKRGNDSVIPKRILYIDSEGWFVTASDQYDREGKLWKSIATFNTYRDRPVPDAKVAIYPYKRMFQIGLVDEDLTTSGTSVVYMPGPEAADHECWYIDMGVVDNAFFTPDALTRVGSQ
jgi:hypothetical protein